MSGNLPSSAPTIAVTKSNKPDRVQLRTDKYDRARPYYNRASPCRIWRNTAIHGEKRLFILRVYGDRIWSPFPPVLHRIRSRRFTIVIPPHNITRENMVAYDRSPSVYDKLRSCTGFVSLDLSKFCSREKRAVKNGLFRWRSVRSRPFPHSCKYVNVNSCHHMTLTSLSIVSL